LIEFWFEFASTYSYPAAMRVEALAFRHARPITWRPFLLGPIFRAQGWEDSPFNIYPAKGRYMWRDLERICAAQGIPFRKPSQFPRNGLLAARVACAVELPQFVKNCYLANFAHDRDISQPAVVADCLAGLVDDPSAVIAAAGEASIKERLRQNTARAQELGIFGAPTLSVGGELFWGNDRLEAAFEYVT
jgi:2-hydroxychromene-2-carboxylate isomerase